MNNAAKILLIEDDPGITDSLRRVLAGTRVIYVPVDPVLI